MTLDGSPDRDNGNSLRPTYVIVVPWHLNYGGGVNEVVINLYRETLSAAEMQPLIMVSEWSAFRPIETLSEGRRTVYLRLWSPWPESGSILGLLKWILMSPVYLTNLVRFCQRHHVVAFNFQYSSLCAFPIALLRFFRLYRGALVLTFQGLDLQEARKAGRIHRMLWRFTLHCTTAVVACSRAFAAEVQAFVGKMGARVHAIHNGVDIDSLISGVDHVGALPSALGNREFILSVATFEHKKGLDVLLRAFVEIRRTNPTLALVLVGRSSHAESELRKLAENLGLAGDVFFCANVPHAQVGLFLERAKVFCLPSRSEPFGIAILEAGAYRLPVVATRVGGIPEFVLDGQTGILVEPDDPKALACALNRALADTDLARHLGEGLYRSTATDFSWRRAYKAYRAFLPTGGPHTWI
jgi:glycosyltransferase involved in cell wall biosynthesis